MATDNLHEAATVNRVDTANANQERETKEGTTPQSIAKGAGVCMNWDVVREFNIRNYPETRELLATNNKLHIDFEANLYTDFTAVVVSAHQDLLPNWTFVQRIETKYSVDAVFLRRGCYQLLISASETGNKPSRALAYTVFVSQSQELPLYPKQHPAYLSLGAYLLEPFYGVLDLDTTELFRVRIPAASEVVVQVAHNRFNLAKDTTDVFQGDAEIAEEHVELWAKPAEGGDWVPILEYRGVSSLRHRQAVAKKQHEVLERWQIQNYPKHRELLAKDNRVHIELEAASEAVISASLKDSKDTAVFERTFVQREGTHFSIDVILPKAGQYELLLSAGANNLPESSLALEYTITSLQPQLLATYPKQKGDGVALGLRLVEPLEGPLKLDSVRLFRLRGDKLSNVEVVVGDNVYPMQLLASGMYEGEVEIEAPEVCLRVQESKLSSWRDVFYFSVAGTPAPTKTIVKKSIETVRRHRITHYPRNRSILLNDNFLHLELPHIPEAWISATLQDEQGLTLPTAIFTQKETTKTAIEALVPGPGHYKLQISAGLTIAEDHLWALQYEIVTSGNGATSMYPRQTRAYHERGVVLSEPKIGVLELDVPQRFRLCVPHADAVVVLIGDNSYPLTQLGNDMHEGVVVIEEPLVNVSVVFADLQTPEPVLEYSVNVPEGKVPFTVVKKCIVLH